MIRLSLHVGRLDWENVLDELTPQQLAVLEVYSGIEPWGDDRDDLRQTIHTGTLVGALGGKLRDENALYRYLKVHEQEALAEASPDRTAAFLESALDR